MKKYLVCVLALTMLIGMSLVSFAAEGSLNEGATVSDSIDVTASVGKYAEILTGDTSVDFDLLGAAEELAEDNDNPFTVESNCLIDLSFSATALTNDDDFIAVVYELFKGEDSLLSFNTDADGNVDDDQTADEVQDYNNGLVTYNINAAATLGAISDQAAGDYEATIYLTVAAAE